MARKPSKASAVRNPTKTAAPPATTAKGKETRKYVAHVVPETHWDRAWYLSFEQFRIKLVKLTEDLLDLLDRKPHYKFTFDGQTVVLEDVVQIRPDFEARLKKHVASGQLAVGPWYVLPDEYLVSGEALVRNLLIGHRISAQYGKTMKAGYIPDPFGHVTQMPQILDGFGIDSILLARGVGEEAMKLGLEFRWMAPDGKSSVMVCHLVDGYGNLLGWGSKWGVELFADEVDYNRAMGQVRHSIDSLISYKPTTRHLLLNNGIDHFPAQPSVPEMIEYVNERLDDAVLVQSDYEDYVRALQSENPRLKTFGGELHDGTRHHILSGVFSARMYLKQANDKSQRALEAYAEPLCAFATRHGMRYPAEFLAYAWKELIKNHPHDDICGCSIDEVHRDMMNRFEHVDQVAEEMAKQAFVTLTGAVDLSAAPAGVPVAVYNPTAWRRDEVVTLKQAVPAGCLTGSKAAVIDAEGKPMAGKVTLAKPRKVPVWHAALIEEIEMRDVEVEFLAEDLPPFGLKTFFLAPTAAKDAAKTAAKDPAAVRTGARFMENEFVRVDIAKDGTLKIKDKTTGAVFADGHVFEDTEDAGDEYDFSPLPGAASRTYLSTETGKVKSIKWVESLPTRATFRIELEFRVPKSLTPDETQRATAKVALPVTTLVTLRRGSRRVDFATTLDNKAKDHRVRVLFGTPIRTDVVHAESKFDVVTRPVVQPEGKDWKQPPVPTQHVDRFVSIDDGKVGFTLINRGMPEYEARKDKRGVTMCQTLLRSCHLISRENMVTRKEHAGPPVDTPEAQCLGFNTYEYAVVPHAGDWESARVFAEAHNHNTPVVARIIDRTVEFQLRGGADSCGCQCPTAAKAGGKVLPLDVSFVRLAPETLVLSAVKQAEEGDALVVRFFNIGTRKAKATVGFATTPKRVERANLNEESLGALKIGLDGGVKFDVAAKEIATLRVEF